MMYYAMYVCYACMYVCNVRMYVVKVIYVMYGCYDVV